MKLKETKIGGAVRAWFYRVYKYRHIIHKRSLDLKNEYYSTDNPKIGVSERMVVAMFDGKVKHGGMADRIRGMLSVYEKCKEAGIPFRIYFRHPFLLENFLEPNEYDWRISDKDMSYNPTESEPVYLIDTVTEAENCLTKIMKSSQKRQIHIYTNTELVFKGGNYSRLFHELFRPSKIVLDDVMKYQKLLVPAYISATTRFQNLLGDFEEQNIIPLDDEEKERLITSCIGKIEELHLLHPGKNILVTSDSYTFLCRAKSLDYVTVIDGRLTHMDWSDNGEIQIHKKSFVDFLLLSGAEHIYLLHTGRMYRSRFPLSASYLGNRPYDIIEF